MYIPLIPCFHKEKYVIRIDLPALVERLNPVARNALENAAASSLNQQATEITVGHFYISC